LVFFYFIFFIIVLRTHLLCLPAINYCTNGVVTVLPMPPARIPIPESTCAFVFPSSPETGPTVPVIRSFFFFFFFFFVFLTSCSNFSAIDHCTDGTAACAPVGGLCVYEGPGVYYCTCQPGYAGTGYTCAGIKFVLFFPEFFLHNEVFFSSKNSM